MMSRYKIHISRQAQRFMVSLNSKTRSRIISELSDFENFPDLSDHHDLIKLKGRRDAYRLRFGDIRAILEISKESKIIYIEKIERRGGVYKG